MGELLPNTLCNSRVSQAGEASLLFRFLSNKAINTTKLIKKGYTMNTNKINLATGYVVIYKEDGLITSYQRGPNNQMKIHNHYKTALNALKKRGINDGFNDGWFITTTVALAKAKWGAL
jgi:hypothetical protein